MKEKAENGHPISEKKLERKMFRKNKMGYNHRKRLKSVSKGETEREMEGKEKLERRRETERDIGAKTEIDKDIE